ncbi:penicillin-binding transpeptidase domain-containing protein [Clostridium tyrobutyricum]|uniref:penicillin-binding transpeptidase domain-containing protein n=1 Tax=Clostridium tyrobutyricum TaxID=1519 RepID=UPI00057C3FAE|nr:penicillin-binding transpeptidase domain-containing protein [Clostridium tyrobutyricum]
MKLQEKKKISRFTALIIVMIVIFSVIAGKLFSLQIVQGAQYKEKAVNRSIRQIADPAPRGNILDKNGNILARSEQSYTLVYNQTDTNDKKFFTTMDKVFKILDANGESQQDDFELKINPFKFEFRSDDPETRKNLEIKFKRDRGLNEPIEKKIKTKNKDISDDELKKQVNDQLLKISPKKTYELLLKKYSINSSYPMEEQRKFMIIKDTIKMHSFSGYDPVVIASNIKKSTALKFSQILNDLPGVDMNIQPIRQYPNKELASGILGYISKISSTDTAKYKAKGYDTNSDYIGQAGIEAAFEDVLKGKKGGRTVKLNNNGKIIQELGTTTPKPGNNVKLTIDKNVQAAAEKALDDRMKELQSNPYGYQGSDTTNATRGAAVVIDVNTGAVIAMASRPGYDPNLFSVPGRLTSEQYNQYFSPNLEKFGRNYIEKRGITSLYPGKSETDVLNILFPLDKSIKGNTTIRQDVYDIYPKPFYNYATQSLIPPGSTFKPMTAIAGLESGVITPDFSIDDEGFFDQGGGHRVEFRTDGRNGWVDLTKAIQKSSNPYFMTVGKRLRDAFGDDTLAKYAWKFGLGADPKSKTTPTTGIELPEKYGQVYNTVSNKNSFANTYLWKVMKNLKDGIDDKGNKLVSLDLYDNANDSDKVKQIKKDIKNLIQSSIKNGSKSFDETKYKELFSELVEKDPNNKKEITNRQMSNLIDAINYTTVSDANSQLNVPANIENASIGQGLNQFTPLQMANYVATIANGGTRYKLHLVDSILDSNGKVIKKIKPEVAEKTGVSAENIAAVKAGMEAVNEKGTASTTFAGFPIKTAGKTGTASLGNQNEIGRTDYAAYVGYAPLDKPQIAVYAVVFDGGMGSGSAQIAKDIYTAYFSKELNSSGTNTNSAQSQN